MDTYKYANTNQIYMTGIQKVPRKHIMEKLSTDFKIFYITINVLLIPLFHELPEVSDMYFLKILSIYITVQLNRNISVHYWKTEKDCNECVKQLLNKIFIKCYLSFI